MSPAPNEVVPGPTARQVVENVIRLRNFRGMTKEALSDRLTEVGRPIRATGLARLEAGKRRVDVDDLVALALALEVSPVALLLPPSEVEKLDLTEKTTAAWEAAWRWAVGEQPLDAGPLHLDARVRAFIESNRPFEHRRTVVEAARFLVARDPSVPYTAHIHIDSQGRAVNPQLTYTDEEGGDGEHQAAP